MESVKQQYLSLREGKMNQAQFMRNVRMSLPQYITNLSSFEDTVKILKNKSILTEADIKEEYGMSLEDAKVEAQRESEEDGVSVHVNSAGKGKYKVSYWFDSDSTVASYEDGILTNEYDEYDDEDNSDYFFDVNDEELNEEDIYGIAGNPEEEEAAKATRMPRREIPSKQEEDDEIEAILKQLEDEEDAKHVMRDKSDFNLKESKIPTGKSLYDYFSEIDRMNGQEVLVGIDYEMEKNPELTKEGAAKIVIKNLKKIPFYYTNQDMSGVEGYEPEYLGGKSANAEARHMHFVGKDNMVDKVMGMKPVKGVEKIKASANKANHETNKAEDMKLMSLVASTLRGVPKMQSQGEKIKIIRIKEALTKLVKEVIQEENTNLKAIAREVYDEIKDDSTDSLERMNLIRTKYKKKYNLSDEDVREVHMWLSDILRDEYGSREDYDDSDYSDYEDNN